MQETIIEVKSLTKKYGEFYANKDISLNIKKGGIYGLVGENGAGKTTLIRLLAGLVSKTSGEIKFYGSSDERDLINARKKFSFIVETPYYVPEMTAYDNLNLQRLQKGINDKKVIDRSLKLAGLEHTGKKQAGKFSLGMRQRLGIAIAMLDSVEVLVLDEPINGLDPQGIIEMRNLLIKLNREYGITILISSHILSELSQIVTDYIFMSDGMMIKQISKEQLNIECSVNYTLDTSDNDKAINVLKKNGYDFNINNLHKLIVFGNVNIPNLSKGLFDNGICIYELFESTTSLEQYYLSLMEGYKND